MRMEVSSENRMRSHFYSLMARLLAKPPDASLLALLRQIPADVPDEGVMSGAWLYLREAAMEADPDSEEEEFESLFYGINGRGVIPYASWYRTNRLTGKPLAKLREDLDRFGIQRVAGNAEQEDHAAALCETMALLCRNNGGEDTYEDTDADQAAFFREHLEPWIESFFADLSECTRSGFYKAVANIGRRFFWIERDLHGLVPENARDGKEIP